MADVDTNELCRSCNKRSICATLCPEAELYVSQDEVNWDEEGTTGIPVDAAFDGSQRPLREPKPVKHIDMFQPKIKLSEKEAEFVSLRLQGFDLPVICKKMKISTARSWDLSRRIKRKMEAAYV